MKATAGKSATVRNAPEGAASPSAAPEPEAVIEAKPVKPSVPRRSVPAKRALPGNSAADAMSAKATSAPPQAAASETSAASKEGDEKCAGVKPAKPKAKKPKLVRDSYTMPKAEYAMLAEIKQACLQAGFEVKKSQLLRIGVRLVKVLDATTLRRHVDALVPLKPRRPKLASPAAAAADE